MVKKKDKELTRKPDLMATAFEATARYMRENVRLCIIGLVVLVVAIASGYAYALHAKSQRDKVEFRLAQGIEAFDAYEVNGKKEDIEKAETAFNDVARKNMGQTYYVAKLYLAKIDYMNGKTEDAKRLYGEVSKGASSPTLKALSEKAVQHLEKK
ncbi:MAG TPA: tetratricopeptide repeat protein [Syntrophorhabdaceae bacterium]|nr:tetratricopeptide repeat protein [Syntrophorhabdaceae bacterium]